MLLAALVGWLVGNEGGVGKCGVYRCGTGTRKEEGGSEQGVNIELGRKEGRTV